MGHLVSANGISPDMSKVQAIKSFPLPRTVRDVRAFLGLAAYYWSFIPNFAALSKPLTQLTQKDSKFCWSEPQQASFDALKEDLEFDKLFILSYDASNYAIYAILSQEHEGRERPLNFASRVLNSHGVNYSTTEKELLAIVFGVQTHRCFLYGRRFKTLTDHAALKWLVTVKNQCARLTQCVLKLAEYDFEILHQPGKKHVNADALSRHVAATVHKLPESSEEAAANLKPLEEVLLTKENIMRAQAKDEFCQQVNQALSEGKTLPYFRDRHSVLYRRTSDLSEVTRVVVCVLLREQVIRQHHDPAFAGHQGEKRMLGSLQLNYYWPSMSKDMEKFIRECASCAKIKGGRVPTAPLGELPETAQRRLPPLIFVHLCVNYFG